MRHQTLEVPRAPRPTFDQRNSAHMQYLWRNARRLGGGDDAIDVLLQELGYAQ